VAAVSGRVPDVLLLDEMFSSAIAAELTALGIDRRPVVADPVLRALSDLEIFLRPLRVTIPNK